MNLFTFLVSAVKIAGVDFVLDVGEVVIPPIGDDEVTFFFERFEVIGDLGAVKLIALISGLVDDDGYALGFHTLHNPLN